MNAHFKHIAQSPLVRDSAKLLSANVIAQVIGIIVYPILTRIYSPEDFGVMNLFCSIAGILALFATAEYQSAIVIPRNNKDAFVLIRWIGVIMIGITLFILLSLPFAHPIAQLFNTPHLADWYWLMPICVITIAGWNVINYWYIRRKEYGAISRYQYSLSILSASSKVGLGYGGLLQGGLIISIVFGQFTALLASIWNNRCLWLSLHRATPFSLQESWKVAKRYRKFPIFNLPRSIVNYISGQLPVLLFAPVFGERCVGFWGMAILLGFAPITMISKTLYQILYGYIANAQKNQESILPFIRRFTFRVIAIELPLLVILYFAMPTLVTWILGVEWLPTADMLQWMLPWIGVIVLTSSTSFFSDLFQQQKTGLYFEIASALTRLGSIGIGIYFHNYMVAVACYAIGNFAVTTAMYLWQISLVRKHEKDEHTN